MDELFEKRWKSIFENHVAKVEQLDEDTQILSWKEEGTVIYSLEFVFRNNMIFVSGDLGYGVFYTTWYPKWDYDWEHINVGYFAEKCQCVKNGIYIWDEQKGIENLKESYSYAFNEEEYDEIFNAVNDLAEGWSFSCWDYVKEEKVFIDHEDDIELLKQMWCALNAIRGTSSQEEYAYTLNSDDDFEDFNDFWEWGYNVGRVLSGYFTIWIIALRMAKEQLLAKGYGGKNEQ